MKAVDSTGADGSRRAKRPCAGVFALAALAGVLAIAYLVHAGEPARLEKEIKIKEAKLRDTKDYIAKNYDSLLGADREHAGTQQRQEDEPLLSVIKETAQGIGLIENLSGVTLEENKKLGEVTAKVALRAVRLADVVNFLVYVRSKYPGIADRDGQLRLARRQDGDNWDAFVSLTSKVR